MPTWEGMQLRVAVFSHPSGPWDQTQVFRVGSGCPLIPFPSPGQTVLAGAAPRTLFLVTAGNGRHWSWPLLFISGHQVCGGHFCRQMPPTHTTATALLTSPRQSLSLPLLTPRSSSQSLKPRKRTGFLLRLHRSALLVAGLGLRPHLLR